MPFFFFLNREKYLKKGKEERSQWVLNPESNSALPPSPLLLKVNARNKALWCCVCLRTTTTADWLTDSQQSVQSRLKPWRDYKTRSRFCPMHRALQIKRGETVERERERVDAQTLYNKYSTNLTGRTDGRHIAQWRWTRGREEPSELDQIRFFVVDCYIIVYTFLVWLSLA
jgi:hypothetical protein